MQQVELLLPNSKDTVSLSFFWRRGGGVDTDSFSQVDRVARLGMLHFRCQRFLSGKVSFSNS